MHSKFLMALRTYIKTLSIIFMVILIATKNNAQVTISTENTQPFQQCITFTFCLKKNDFLYKDFICFSVDNPDVSLSPWTASREPISYYDPLFKNTKHIFTGTVVISLDATAQKQYIPPATVYCSYYQKSAKKIITLRHPLFLATQQSKEHSDSPDTWIQTVSQKNSLVHALRVDSPTATANTPCKRDAFASLPHMIAITITTSCTGFLSIKKSTELTWNHLRTVCTILGGLLIAASLFFVFKTLQLFFPL